MRLQDRVANELLLPSGDARIALIDMRDITAVAAKLRLNGVQHGEAFRYGEVARGCLPSRTGQLPTSALRLRVKSRT